MNMVILIGHLADEPKTGVTAGGAKKCTFRLATQREYTNQQTGKHDADFHTVIVWQQLADLCAQYLAKGRLCMVRGSVQYRSYNAQDGSKRYITEIVADKVKFLEKRQPSNGQNAQQNDYVTPEGFIPVDNDELPF